MLEKTENELLKSIDEVNFFTGHKLLRKIITDENKAHVSFPRVAVHLII